MQANTAKTARVVEVDGIQYDADRVSMASDLSEVTDSRNADVFRMIGSSTLVQRLGDDKITPGKKKPVPKRHASSGAATAGLTVLASPPRVRVVGGGASSAALGADDDRSGGEGDSEGLFQRRLSEIGSLSMMDLVASGDEPVPVPVHHPRHVMEDSGDEDGGGNSASPWGAALDETRLDSQRGADEGYPMSQHRQQQAPSFDGEPVVSNTKQLMDKVVEEVNEAARGVPGDAFKADGTDYIEQLADADTHGAQQSTFRHEDDDVGGGGSAAAFSMPAPRRSVLTRDQEERQIAFYKSELQSLKARGRTVCDILDGSPLVDYHREHNRVLYQERADVWVTQKMRTYRRMFSLALMLDNTMGELAALNDVSEEFNTTLESLRPQFYRWCAIEMRRRPSDPASEIRSAMMELFGMHLAMQAASHFSSAMTNKLLFSKHKTGLASDKKASSPNHKAAAATASATQAQAAAPKTPTSSPAKSRSFKIPPPS